MNLSKWASEHALDIWIECVESGDDTSDRVWEVADGAFCYHADTIEIWSTHGDHDELSELCEPSHDIGNLLMINATLHARDALYSALEDFPDPSRVSERVEECCEAWCDQLAEGEECAEEIPDSEWDSLLAELDMTNSLDWSHRERLFAFADKTWAAVARAHNRYL